ncbi:MAG: diguanylate cyclase [Nitrospirae bacterium]|nr:MAG: diguanylate cyclase [Nitrospirota bacterium]
MTEKSNILTKAGILIIDDDPNLRKTLSDILGAKGYETLTAKDAAEGLSLVRQCSFDVVLIDLGLPDIPGIEVLNKVKASRPSAEAIILTGNATLDSAIEATNKGAFSYLQKPYDVDQLLLHIKRAVEKREADRKILLQSTELKKINTELRVLYTKANFSSLHDPLTGLANRRFLEVQLEKHYAAAKRYGQLLSVIMLDIDHFKLYNDTRGHVEGDSLLVRFAQTVLETVRTADYVFRFGGEEFLVMLPGTDRDHACMAAERLRRVVESEAGVTISIGVSSFSADIATKEQLIENADKALYEAKNKGRNRVEAWPCG